MEHTIQIIEDRLSDGSRVYDVRLNGENFGCVTENDAITLMSKIIAAIGEHTVDTCRTLGF